MERRRAWRAACVCAVLDLTLMPALMRELNFVNRRAFSLARAVRRRLHNPHGNPDRRRSV